MEDDSNAHELIESVYSTGRFQKIDEESAETIVVDSTLDGEVSISSRSREQPNTSDKVDIDLANQMEDDSNAHELFVEDYINSSNENTKSFSPPQMDRHASYEEVQSLTSSLPRVFLLHLSKETFNDDNRALMTESILEAIKEKIPIILVHEQDLTKEAAPDFSYFLQNTPQQLIDPPINLYSDIAIRLYTRKEYRQISLHLIVDKIKSSVYVETEKKGMCWQGLLRRN